MHKCPDRAVMSYSYLTQSASATSLPKCTFSGMTTGRKISQICDGTDKLHLLRRGLQRYAKFGRDIAAWVVGSLIFFYAM